MYLNMDYIQMYSYMSLYRSISITSLMGSVPFEVASRVHSGGGDKAAYEVNVHPVC